MQNQKSTLQSAPHLDIQSNIFIAILICGSLFMAQHTYGFDDLGYQPNDFWEPTIVPISQMSDKQIFLTAKLQRENKVPLETIKANYYWVQRQRGRGYTGGSALREVAKAAFKQLYPNFHFSDVKGLFRKGRKNTYQVKHLEQQDEKFVHQRKVNALQQLDNYSLSVSSRRVRLRFAYEF